MEINMNLIQISSEYFIDIEKYSEIKIGDLINSQIQLKRKICYPEIIKDSTTLKNLNPILDLFIKHEKVGSGNKIRITSIELPQKVIEIIENHLKLKTNRNSRQSYRCNRLYLLDCLMHSQESETVYFTKRQIINESTIYQEFYYDYCKINYDPEYSNAIELLKFKAFVEEYNINYEFYFVDTMNKFNNIFYNTIFDTENILNWGESRKLKPKQVLVQNMKELDEETSNDITVNYIQPLKDRGIPAKNIIRLANKNYAKAKNIQPKDHVLFHHAFKLTKPESFIVDIDDEKLNHDKHEISKKAIEKLISKAVDSHGNNYHARNAHNFQEIIEKIKV
jgi:hypothetical protein